MAEHSMCGYPKKIGGFIKVFEFPEAETSKLDVIGIYSGDVNSQKAVFLISDEP